MRAQAIAAPRAATQPASFAPPARALLLQRKCACGGAAGLSGECEECRKKRLGVQRHAAGAAADLAPSMVHEVPHSPDEPRDLPTRVKSDSRPPHDFSRISLLAPPSNANIESKAQIRVLSQVPPGQEEGIKFSEDNIRMTLQGSGTCQNGGADSACDPASGAYKIKSNNNTCCTRACTQQHEGTHVSDVTGWGCCKALSKAYNAKGADKNALVTKYNQWLNKVVAITECHAYSNDVRCADSLAVTKDCGGSGKGTDCCKDIADYRTKYAASAKTNCAAAPKDAEPCPVF
jgi:hypothetical protein